jgi:chemotaxis protein histidine kinase CheA
MGKEHDLWLQGIGVNVSAIVDRADHTTNNVVDIGIGAAKKTMKAIESGATTVETVATTAASDLYDTTSGIVDTFEQKASGAAKSAESILEDAKKKAADLEGHAKKQVEQLVDDARKKAGEAVIEAQKKKEALSKQAEQLIRDAKSKGAAAVEEAKKKIAELKKLADGYEDEAKKKAEAAAKEAEKKAQELKDAAEKKAKELKEAGEKKAKEAAGNAVEKAKEVGNQAQKKGTEAEEKIKQELGKLVVTEIEKQLRAKVESESARSKDLFDELNNLEKSTDANTIPKVATYDDLTPQEINRRITDELAAIMSLEQQRLDRAKTARSDARAATAKLERDAKYMLFTGASAPATGPVVGTIIARILVRGAAAAGGSGPGLATLGVMVVLVAAIIGELKLWQDYRDNLKTLVDKAKSDIKGINTNIEFSKAKIKAMNQVFTNPTVDLGDIDNLVQVDAGELD